jgi:hypothetical protein
MSRPKEQVQAELEAHEADVLRGAAVYKRRLSELGALPPSSEHRAEFDATAGDLERFEARSAEVTTRLRSELST